MERTTVKTAIVLRGKKNNTFNLQEDFIYSNSNSDNFGKLRKHNPTQSSQYFKLKNLSQNEGLTGITATSAEAQLDAVYSSPFVFPDILNEMVIQLYHYREEEFNEIPPAPYNSASYGGACPSSVHHSGWNSKNIYDSDYGFNSQFAFRPMSFTTDQDFVNEWGDFLNDYYFELKILVDYYFTTPGYNNSDNNTTQVYTYLISPEDYIFTPWMNDVPFDLVHHPSHDNEIYSLEPELGLTDTYFDMSLMSQFPLLGTGFDVRATEVVTINGELTIDDQLFPVSHVDIVAGNEIIVTGESVLIGDFTLSLDPFWTSSPTPSITNQNVIDFCKGLVPLPYAANLNSRSTDEFQNSSEETKNPIHLSQTEILIHPNPASSIINLSLQGITGMVEFTIYNSVGVPVATFRQQLDSGASIHYVQHNISQLADGIYTIAVRSSEHSFAKKFVVAH